MRAQPLTLISQRVQSVRPTESSSLRPTPTGSSAVGLRLMVPIGQLRIPGRASLHSPVIQAIRGIPLTTSRLQPVQHKRSSLRTRCASTQRVQIRSHSRVVHALSQRVAFLLPPMSVIIFRPSRVERYAPVLILISLLTRTIPPTA